MTVRLVNQPTPSRPSRELLFEFLHGHTRIRCELVDHGDYGVEAQFLRNEEFSFSRTFHPRLNPQRTPREMAIGWAEAERAEIERDAPAAS